MLYRVEQVIFFGYSEDGEYILLQNACIYIPSYMASYSGRLKPSLAPCKNLNAFFVDYIQFFIYFCSVFTGQDMFSDKGKFLFISCSVSGTLHHYHSNADCIVIYPALMTVYFLTKAFQSKNQMLLKSWYWHSCGIITDVTTGNISMRLLKYGMWKCDK